MNTLRTVFLPLVALIPLLLTGCYSVKRSVADSKPNSAKIRWPEAYQPEEAQFFVHNEIDIAASPEAVWEVLMQAETWPDWYEGAKDVQVLHNPEGRLTEEAVFTWNTMGLDFTSTITEFERPYRLAWESEKPSIRGYHAWLIIPTEAGCKLITSESQYGFMTYMQKAFVPNKLRKLHDVWLANIKQRAESQASLSSK